MLPCVGGIRMPNKRVRALTVFILALAMLPTLYVHRSLQRSNAPSGTERESKPRGPGPYPSDWFGAQRAFPGNRIPQEKFQAALEQADFDRALEAAKPTSAALVWSNQGPFNIGGRVTALAAVPGGLTVYLASANGGVFKSTNSGANWTPIFDSQAAFSVGALALVPGTSSVLYVGTGESNGSVDSYDGAGLFRTQNGGGSWEFLGLEATRRIARVVVDPKNVNRIFVAAMGTQ